MKRNSLILSLLGLMLVPLFFSGCSNEIEADDMEMAEQERIRFYFNNTGTRRANQINPAADDMLVQMIDRADSTIDCAVMGFTRYEVIDAILRAYMRGVRIRFVGDGRHMEGGTIGYLELDRWNIPMMIGNMYSIMHNKFFVIDDRFVVTGTGNMTPTGFDKNANNYAFIDSPQVARDFTDEFEQMFDGRFGAGKIPLDNGNDYQVGDTRMEVYFSPQEDAMGKILEYIHGAKHSVHFMIFAFTKDQIGSGFIDKHQEFSLYNTCCGPGSDDLSGDQSTICQEQVVCQEPFVPKGVHGVIDRSQLHSNGPYHEAYRMLMFGVNMRLDGSDNSYQPGDYQAGGGRMHSKTMIIDAGTPDAKVLTGSFNWSSSATIANDETFLVFHGERAARETLEFWETHWTRGKPFGVDFAGENGTVKPGDIVFNEIHWDGWNGENDSSDFGGDDVSNDEFIELLNTTNRTIDLSMWTIGSEDDFTMGIYPGTVIGPHERFLIVDHNLAPFSDLDPQDTPSAFKDPDFVMNGANDARFLRLNLHNARLGLRLIDPRGNVIDRAGNNGPPFKGGRVTQGGSIKNYSMERIHPIKDGDDPSAWRWCAAEEGGKHVHENFRSRIIATPGEANSKDAFAQPEPTGFRTENE